LTLNLYVAFGNFLFPYDPTRIVLLCIHGVTKGESVFNFGLRIYATALLLHTVNCGRFYFWRRQSVVFFFLCVWNVSGTAERICAKFTRKTCLVRRSDEFEDQG